MSWSVFMRWHELLFMHWPVSPARLRALIPAPLEELPDMKPVLHYSDYLEVKSWGIRRVE